MKKFKFTFNSNHYFILQARSMREAYDKFNKYFPNAENIKLAK